MRLHKGCWSPKGRFTHSRFCRTTKRKHLTGVEWPQLSAFPGVIMLTWISSFSGVTARPGSPHSTRQDVQVWRQSDDKIKFVYSGETVPILVFSCVILKNICYPFCYSVSMCWPRRVLGFRVKEAAGVVLQETVVVYESDLCLPRLLGTESYAILRVSQQPLEGLISLVSES